MQSAIISEDLTIEGDLLAKESSLTILGTVTGDVSARAIDVQPTGVVTGTLSTRRDTSSACCMLETTSTRLWSEPGGPHHGSHRAQVRTPPLSG